MAEINKSKTDDGNSESCPTDCEAGPVREKGGTTGAGNLSPQGANRTGGATSGVALDSERAADRAAELTPDP